MTIDTSALTDSATQIIQQVFDYLPLGVAVFGVVGALVGGLMFGRQFVNIIVSALANFR